MSDKASKSAHPITPNPILRVLLTASVIIGSGKSFTSITLSSNLTASLISDFSLSHNMIGSDP